MLTALSAPYSVFTGYAVRPNRSLTALELAQSTAREKERPAYGQSSGTQLGTQPDNQSRTQYQGNGFYSPLLVTQLADNFVNSVANYMPHPSPYRLYATYQSASDNYSGLKPAYQGFSVIA